MAGVPFHGVDPQLDGSSQGRSLLMDGCIRSIGENIDLQHLQRLGMRAGGEVVSDF